MSPNLPSPPPTRPVRWLDPQEQRAWRAFIDGTQRLLAVLDRDLEEVVGLGLDDYRVLVLLSEAPEGALRMSALADGVLSSHSKMSHHARRLEEAGLLRRRPCPRDLRGVEAVLTDKGWGALRAAAPVHVAGVRENLVDLLDAGQLTALREIFAALETGPPRCRSPRPGRRR